QKRSLHRNSPVVCDGGLKQLEQQLNPQLSSCLIYQLRLIQSTTASFCPYCQVWAFLARRTPGLNRTSLGARSMCHGKVSCLSLTPLPQGCPKARLWDHFSLPFTPPRWALSSARMVFPIIAMPMILNCICRSLLRTPLSLRGSRTVLLIHPHGGKIT